MKNGRKLRWFLIPVVLIGVAIAGLVIYRSVSGQSLGLRSWVETRWYYFSSSFKVVADSRNVTALNKGEFTNIIFLHHSVGDAIISEGGLRELLSMKGYQLSDQDYVQYGLTGPNGDYRGYTLPIPSDNTNPDGLATIFSQPLLPLPVNAFSGLMQYEVILVKSCFPANDIDSDAKLEQYKEYYHSIQAVIDTHPQKLFILFTIPPLNRTGTSAANAARASALAEWMISDEFVEGHPNLAVFDLFGILAERDPGKANFNALKTEYAIGEDSHPNDQANRVAAQMLADFVDSTVQNYREFAKIDVK